MLKRLYFVLLLAMCLFNAQAQRPFVDSLQHMQDSVGVEYADDEVYGDEDSTVEELYDTILNVYPIEILQDSVQSWKNKKQLAYLKNLDSLLKASEKKESAKKNDKASAPNVSWLGQIFNGSFFKTLLWSMAGIFVVVVLYQLFKNKGLFRQNVVKPEEEQAAPSNENLLEQDFDSLILQAKRAEDFRLATRYQFLKTLQLLKEKELIEFSLEKTNSLYVREVPEKFRNDFARLILNYEYVWYGEFSLSPQQYELLQQKYTSFNEKI